MQLYILPAKMPPASVLDLYNASFELWESVWFETLQELDGIQALHSDAFTLQDFFAVVVLDQKPAALCCFKMLDLRLQSHQKDSWLAPWPKSLIGEIAKTHPQALIPSWLSVHADYRKSSGFQGVNLALVMSEMISLVCLEVGADIAFGTPRKDRSVNKLVYQAGATCLAEDVSHHGVLVDLVSFDPKNLRLRIFSTDTQKLWQQRLDMTNKKPQKDLRYESRL